jgi:hypothetical protein
MSVPAAAQWIHIQRLSPENKGTLPYIALQTGYRNKKQSLTHMWLLVISLATSSSVLSTVFRFSFFKFQFPAMSSPPPHYSRMTNQNESKSCYHLKGLRKMCIPGRGGYLKLKGKVNI